MRGIRACLCACSTLSLIVGTASPAFAQDASDAAARQGNAESEARRPTDIVVTAQKRIEKVQDVPIAISAFSGEDLNAQKVEGGFDLMKAVPNLTFSKNNFSGYNISIRGIGTKSISTTSDAGAAVSFNNTTLLRNRLFEQEYFDVERLEVLRGPQGTLYGRNATAGVINLISAKPKLNRFEGSIKGEVGNYNSRRLVGMLNIPIVTDKLGLRLAGSMTQREGYDYNSVTKHRINGRDLWSGRVTLGFEPVPSVRGSLIWERFHEKDDRSRTGKQVCHRDAGPEMVGSTPTEEANPFDPASNPFRRALFSTGCKAGSIYDDAAFGTPNGLALSPITALLVLNQSFGFGTNAETGQAQYFLNLSDPYGGMMQSRNLREIASFNDPRYRAGADILQFNLDIDVTDALTLSSQTAFNWDKVYSFQDFNRFNTVPVFNDTSLLLPNSGGNGGDFRQMAPGGIFCDPQIGCSNTIGTFDVASSDSKQFSQELRIQSDFDGAFNFSLGANYTKFKAREEYIVMSNITTALSMIYPVNGSGNQTTCGIGSAWLDRADPPTPIEDSFCPYIDPNPVESINGLGHNYFRSSNPYWLTSYGLFGEAYWNINPDLKLTMGLRYNHDRKRFTPIPSQLLMAPTIIGGGLSGIGYPAEPDINLKWGNFTGRIGLDWKPVLSFTDETMLYAFFSRGYKGGGMNPPSPGFATGEQMVKAGIFKPGEGFYDFLVSTNPDLLNVLTFPGKEYGPTFKPEYVNAFEIGAKNSLLGGTLILNASAFYYDYKDYQVSQIRDRTAVNENFDSTIYGAELQAVFSPAQDFRLIANIGYLKTRIADGESSIDIMNRNLGDPDYTVFKPWFQLPSNCVVPTAVAERWLQDNQALGNYWGVCGGVGGLLGMLIYPPIMDPATGQPYDPANYPELNGGAGLKTDLSGNEMPNSPRWTVNLGAEYTMHFGDNWSTTIRGDGYWQAKSWARVYNLNPYDRLRSWTNFNLTLAVDGPEGLHMEAYVKNVFNSTPITDSFLNSDDAALTTNVFTLDPRIIGFSIAKKF
ncbi:TonB-dependent receptor [Sphingopyxis panaciterrulae]|uniref:Outer membrane receptor protein involved in Fe transport n=1 Tax=Sphingopyxis panaciterrulae TaxID=462372 RepID=A0A7W9ES91_9SPHN|nr:TonB-dependent receptor [Sphingopyxis panaciterrulae]MBB5708508.1 outer membrane receptor protein involved in Fe transport [Sphingopyxis panaciterrulae]